MTHLANSLTTPTGAAGRSGGARRGTVRRLVGPPSAPASSETALSILDRTIEVIDTGGESALRIHELSAHVGVAVTSIYHFFGCREGLVEAAHAERHARCLDRELSVFTAAARRCRTRTEFESVIRQTVERWGSSQQSATRMILTSSVGASNGRPRLSAMLALTHERSIAVLGETLRRPQERGWICAHVDLSAFAAWFLAIMLQRAMLDIGPMPADARSWVELSTAAALALLSGAPARATLVR